MIFEKLTQTLAAGQAWKLGMAGDEFRITSAFWPCSVTLFKNNQIIGTASNWLSGDFVRGVDFDAVQIVSATAQEVGVFICSGGAGSDRITGEVSVIDGGKQRSSSNIAFLASVYSTQATAQFACCQLWNPVGSGKNIIIESISFSAATAMPVSIGNSVVPQSNQSQAYSLSSKFAGGANGAAQTRYESSATPTYVKQFLGYYIAANLVTTINFREPYILPPGFGFITQSGVANVALLTNFEWFEE